MANFNYYANRITSIFRKNFENIPPKISVAMNYMVLDGQKSFDIYIHDHSIKDEDKTTIVFFEHIADWNDADKNLKVVKEFENMLNHYVAKNNEEEIIILA